MKQIIKINETDLHNLIKECVNKCLNEGKYTNNIPVNKYMNDKNLSYEEKNEIWKKKQERAVEKKNQYDKKDYLENCKNRQYKEERASRVRWIRHLLLSPHTHFSDETYNNLVREYLELGGDASAIHVSKNFKM